MMGVLKLALKLALGGLGYLLIAIPLGGLRSFDMIYKILLVEPLCFLPRFFG